MKVGSDFWKFSNDWAKERARTPHEKDSKCHSNTSLSKVSSYLQNTNINERETFLRGASLTSGNYAVEETYTNWGSIELKNRFMNQYFYCCLKIVKTLTFLNTNQGLYYHSNGCHCSFVYNTPLCTGKYMSWIVTDVQRKKLLFQKVLLKYLLTEEEFNSLKAGQLVFWIFGYPASFPSHIVNELFNKLKFFYSSAEVVWILNASTSSDITWNNLSITIYGTRLGQILGKTLLKWLSSHVNVRHTLHWSMSSVLTLFESLLSLFLFAKHHLLFVLNWIYSRHYIVPLRLFSSFNIF